MKIKTFLFFAGIAYLLFFASACSTPNRIDNTRIPEEQHVVTDAEKNDDEIPEGRVLTNSYILAQAEKGRILPPEEILVDSYLSSIDYYYPEPKKNLEVYLFNAHDKEHLDGQDGFLQIGLKGKEFSFAQLPPLNIAFVVDMSSSMQNENKTKWVKDALSRFTKKVRNNDTMSLVGFNDTAQILFESAKMNNAQKKEAFVSALGNLKFEGEANLEAGLALGYEQVLLGFDKNAVNIVILLSAENEFSSRLAQAGSRSGDIRVSLMWNNRNDLDVSVITPENEIVSFFSPIDSHGGMLDVDMNVCGESSEAVENIFWGSGKAPFGTYNVYVKNYRFHESDREPTNFRVKLKNGDQYKYFEGIVTGSGSESTVPVCSFRFDGTETKDAVSQIAGKYLKNGISISCLSLGSDIDIELMRALAREGGGSARLFASNETILEFFGSDLEFERIAVKTAEEVNVKLDFPADVEIVEVFGYPCDVKNNTLSFRIPFIYSGDSETILVHYRVPASETGKQKTVMFSGTTSDSSGGQQNLPAKQLDLSRAGDQASCEKILYSKTIVDFTKALKDIGNIYYDGGRAPSAGSLESARTKAVETKKELENAKSGLTHKDALVSELAIVSAYITFFDDEIRKNTMMRARSASERAVIISGPAAIEAEKVYQVQVGAFLNARNSEASLKLLRGEGLPAKIEKFGNYDRVVIPNIKGLDIEDIAYRVGPLGFKKIWVRD